MAAILLEAVLERRALPERESTDRWHIIIKSVALASCRAEWNRCRWEGLPDLVSYELSWIFLLCIHPFILPLMQSKTQQPLHLSVSPSLKAQLPSWQIGEGLMQHLTYLPLCLCLWYRAGPNLIVTLSTCHPAALSSLVKTGPCLLRASRLACRSVRVALTIPLTSNQAAYIRASFTKEPIM